MASAGIDSLVVTVRKKAKFKQLAMFSIQAITNATKSPFRDWELNLEEAIQHANIAKKKSNQMTATMKKEVKKERGSVARLRGDVRALQEQIAANEAHKLKVEAAAQQLAEAAAEAASTAEGGEGGGAPAAPAGVGAAEAAVLRTELRIVKEECDTLSMQADSNMENIMLLSQELRNKRNIINGYIVKRVGDIEALEMAASKDNVPSATPQQLEVMLEEALLHNTKLQADLTTLGSVLTSMSAGGDN